MVHACSLNQQVNPHFEKKKKNSLQCIILEHGDMLEEGSKRVKAVVWGSQESQHQIIDPWEVMLVQAGVIQESYV